MAVQILSRRGRWNLCVLVSLLWTTQIAAYGVDQGSSRSAQQTENSLSSIAVEQQDRPKSHDLSDPNSSWAQRQEEPVDDEQQQQHVLLSRSRNRGLKVHSHETFVTKCVEYMLSDKALDDNIASQNELASFLRQQCVLDGICVPSKSLPFESLTIRMQTLFVSAVCNESDPDNQDKCRNILKPDEYGFRIEKKEDIDKYRPILKDMCVK
eukprot:scaffold674290_cov71-Attheya_sp.AAC.1